ncbi:MAG TPA: peptidylprolyl isomerase [Methanomicrobia archaeon]|nr:peptidylprolyl isomerase [Methanomicrobia archaeon]
MKRNAIAGVVITIAVIIAVLCAGCAEKEAEEPAARIAETAKIGDMVKVHYTGTLADGSVFDSSLGRDPLQFTLGDGQMIPGFEQAVIGMKLGETKTVTIPADQAYGPYYEERVFVIPRDQLPAGMEPEIGQKLRTQSGMIVTVTEVSGTSVTLDANHELAGKDLTFEIQLVEIS